MCYVNVKTQQNKDKLNAWLKKNKLPEYDDKKGCQNEEKYQLHFNYATELIRIFWPED